MIEEDSQPETGVVPRIVLEPRPLRVLIVAPSLEILGGQAVQADRLLKQLSKISSLEVSLLPVNPHLPGPLRLLQKVKYLRTFVTSLLYLITLFRWVPRYDVIHIFSASYFSFLLAPAPAILVARFYGRKTLLNYRSGEAEDHLRRARKIVLPIIRLVDKIVVPSEYLVEVFRRYGFSSYPIPNFVDPGIFRFRSRTNPQPRFLSNRSFEPSYNVECTLRSFAMIQRRFPEASLTLVGDGSQRAELEALANELGLRRVFFAGRVQPSKMSEFYEKADIYLNSPDIDNMPTSLIEAFASGIPIVTTDAGGIPLIVKDGETGLVSPRGDCEAMARSAIRLIEDPDLAFSIAQKAWQQCQKYTWQTVEAKWLGVYYELAGRTSSEPDCDSAVGRHNGRESLRS
ncbi:MAG TPA: glycosyltransferase family 4 protein [Pyrinomonadaceae bacterium]|nr:glycosyltransferase family 4 protein [Pyrinomonadaceae bacterium]